MTIPRSYDEFWAVIDPIVRDEGFRLFDIVVPKDKRQPLKVFIARDDLKSSGISIDNCASVHRRLSDLFEAEYGEEWSGAMEVSSPGVNRRLTRPEHFNSAVGERIKIITRANGASEVLKGELKRFDDTGIDLLDERTGEAVTIPLSDVEKAQVDFLFE